MLKFTVDFNVTEMVTLISFYRFIKASIWHFWPVVSYVRLLSINVSKGQILQTVL